MKSLQRLITVLAGAAALVACSGADEPEDFIYTPKNYGTAAPTAETKAPPATNAAPLPLPKDTPPKPETAPGLTGLSPAAVTLGSVPSSGADVTVTGRGFLEGATVELGTVLLATKSVTDTQLVVHLGPERLQAAGDLALSVVNPSGLTSNKLTFTVATPSSVSIKTLSPSQVNALGTSTVTVDVNGAGFIPSTTARFNGTPVETVFRSATLVSAIVPASALQTAGRYSVTVSNSGTVVSLPSPFDVLNAAPVITAVTPPSIRQAAASVTIELQGKNFTAASTVIANGAPQSSAYVTYVSPTRLQVLVNAASAVGVYRLQVATPAPGGGTSGIANFQITY